MTGDLGGFLVKLSKADGKCVWAKDMAFSKRVAANANTVWTMYSDDDPYEFDAAHTVNPANRDVIMGRFQAVDGVGEWGVAMGGARPGLCLRHDYDAEWARRCWLLGL